ncbi:MAG: Na/Pi symporter [Bacteroidia bacterium]
MTTPNFWQLFAGLGLFLYGMFHLEDAMKQLEGRSFKLFLQKYTKNKLSAILSGAGVTAILQSSSIVNLILLSFVGAGMLTMRNAIGVVLGANVGGTFNSWLVALLGFNTNITKFTLPVIGFAGIALIVFHNNRKIYQTAKFFMGFGLLFLGLQFMKESMDSLLKAFDFAPYLHYHRLVFVLIGFVITALIQTSAATVVIVLSAVYATIIPIETAVAIVLGAELGTTIKLLIGSIGGISAKKRVAASNIIFNIVTSIFGFVLLVPIIKLLRDVIGIQNPLIIIVAFQTFINIAGVIFFYFFLNSLADFLEKYFRKDEKSATSFLQNTSPEIFVTALEMIEKETGLFIYRTIHLNMGVFKIDEEGSSENQFHKREDSKTLFSSSLPYVKKYHLLKQAEGEILSFYAKMMEQEINQENFIHLNQLMAAVRNAMYSAKSMKDIDHDRIEFSNSVNELKYDSYQLFRKQLSIFYAEINQILFIKDKIICGKKLASLFEKIKLDYRERLKNSYKEIGKDVLKEVDISTLFILNRELYSSCKAIILSLKDYLLDTEIAEKFEDNLSSLANK